jgi:hypothetical protein
MEIIKNPPSLAHNKDGFYIYQNHFDQKSKNSGNSVIYTIICLVSNLDNTFGNNLSLDFSTVFGEFQKKVSELHLQISGELTQAEIIQFAADCNQTDNYKILKIQLEILKECQPLGNYYKQAQQKASLYL